jgi:hypothetical protein
MVDIISQDQIWCGSSVLAAKISHCLHFYFFVSATVSFTLIKKLIPLFSFLFGLKNLYISSKHKWSYRKENSFFFSTKKLPYKAVVAFRSSWTCLQSLKIRNNCNHWSIWIKQQAFQIWSLWNTENDSKFWIYPLKWTYSHFRICIRKYACEILKWFYITNEALPRTNLFNLNLTNRCSPAVAILYCFIVLNLSNPFKMN